MRVSLGNQTQLNGSHLVTRHVDKIVLHPDYNTITRDNDIAVVRLNSPVEFTDFIRPVCLAAGDSVFNHGTVSWVAEWRKIKEDGK